MKKVIFNLIVVLSSLIGLILTFLGNNFMSNNSIYYFTIQSNIWIMIISLIFIFYDISEKKIPNILNKIKFILVVAINLTFLVFNFMLVPEMLSNNSSLTDLFSISNITLHIISPIFAMLSFVLYDKDIKESKHTFCLGIIMPLIYFIFCMIVSTFTNGIFAGSGNYRKFPYFFLNYIDNGWFTISSNVFKIGTFYWSIIILVVVLLVGKMLLYLNRRFETND